MPEAERLSEIDREEDGARDQRDEARNERDPRRELVARVAAESKQRPERVAAARETTEEEVAEDPPLPLGRRREVLGPGHACGRVLLGPLPFMRPLRNATRPAMRPMTAVATPPT